MPELNFKTIEALRDELNQLFTASNGEPVRLCVHQDADGKVSLQAKEGAVMYATLVPDKYTLPNFEDNKGGIVCYPRVKVSGEGIANVMSGTMLQFLSRLSHFDEYDYDYRVNCAACLQFAEDHKNEDPNVTGPSAILHYQDWHENLFGFRPWGWEFNIRHDGDVANMDSVF